MTLAAGLGWLGRARSSPWRTASAEGIHGRKAARRLLGLSETSWAKWAEEIRTSVGRELLRAGMFPPARYFREMTTGK